MIDPRDLLVRETAHFSGSERDQVSRMLNAAEDLARHAPNATDLALCDKLCTWFEAPRWVRLLVARAALQAPRPVSPAIAA